MLPNTFIKIIIILLLKILNRKKELNQVVDYPKHLKLIIKC